MTKTTIDIQAFINEHPFTRYQWMILALCFITVAMDGFDTAIIGLSPPTWCKSGAWKNRLSAR